MTEYVYNSAKNANINHMPFKPGFSYQCQMLNKENINFCFKSKSIDKFLAELKELLIVY